MGSPGIRFALQGQGTDMESFAKEGRRVPLHKMLPGALFFFFGRLQKKTDPGLGCSRTSRRWSVCCRVGRTWATGGRAPSWRSQREGSVSQRWGVSESVSQSATLFKGKPTNFVGECANSTGPPLGKRLDCFSEWCPIEVHKKG